MPDIPVWSDFFRIGRDEALARNERLSREAIEREGTDSNALIAAAAAMADEVAGQVADLSFSLFLGSAVGDDLDRLLYDRYGMTREPAAASIGSAEFRTTAPSPTTFAIPSSVAVQTADGKQFLTTEEGVFPVGTIGPLVLAMRSILAGLGQQAKTGEINSIVSQITGQPTDLRVTNTLATTGGADEETNDDFRERGRRFFTTARRGTLAAIEAAALNVPGIRRATAFEVLDSSGRPARLVQLVVADSFAEQFVSYATVPPSFAAKSQAITTAIIEAMRDVRGGGIYVQVTVANVVIQPIQLALAFKAGASVNEATLRARAAVVNVTNSLAPGKTWRVQDMLAALKLVPGLQYTGREIISPVGDVVPRPLQVIRVALGAVSAMSAQTDVPMISGQNPDAFVLAE